jgi:hypothetical protein
VLKKKKKERILHTACTKMEESKICAAAKAGGMSPIPALRRLKQKKLKFQANVKCVISLKQ